MRKLFLTVLLFVQASTWAQTTSFTYQGRLAVNGSEANGDFEVKFGLFEFPAGGSSTVEVTNANIAVANGLFTTVLDLGPVFTGTNYWLELSVRTNGSTGIFETLLPRQPITAAPYALSARSVSGSVDASQLTGTAAIDVLPGVVLTNGSSGVALTGTFSGNGAALTNINAALLNGVPSEAFSTNRAFLHLVVEGTGGGTISSSSLGISTSRSLLIAATVGASVDLSAVADGISTFAGWTGPCTGTGPCNITIHEGVNTIRTVFEKKMFTLTVMRTGAGTIVSDPPGLNCGNVCTVTVPAGTMVSLTAVPDPGMTFAGWGSGCSGTGSCITTMTQNRTVMANFTGTPTFQGNVIGDGAGLANVNAATLNGLAGSSFWKTGGNAGTASNAFLGTLDNLSLELKVNDSRAVRFEPNGSATPTTLFGPRASAAHPGSFVWADSNAGPFGTTAADQFLVRATGGIGFGSGTETMPSSFIHVGTTGRLAQAAGFVPDPFGSSGLFLETVIGNEGAGIFMNGNTMALWNPGDSDFLRIYDEDSLPTGEPKFKIDGFGVLHGNGAGLTNLTVSGYSGPVSDSQLSANIPRLSSGNLTIGGTVNAVSFSGNGADLSGVWKLGGNSGTTPGTDFIGTTDDTALDFKVNGERALRIIPNATAPSIIGGHHLNHIPASVYGATIAGGGDFSGSNAVLAAFGTVGGGMGNIIETNGDAVVIGGGANNRAAGSTSATIAGGIGNIVTNLSDQATISGGARNVIHGSIASVIGGGVDNTLWINTGGSTLGGGLANTVEPGADHAVIGGGRLNVVGTNSSVSTIGGGSENRIASGAFASTLAGGQENFIGAAKGVISGGEANAIFGGAFRSIIGGGSANTIQSNATDGVVGGGFNNSIKLGAVRSTIGGGFANAIHATDSTIAGGQSNLIETNAIHAVIGGGGGNQIRRSAMRAVIAGGNNNVINTNASYAAILGGLDNTIQAGSLYSAIGGGQNHQVFSNSAYATIPGGFQNRATNFAFAAGHNARATNTGAFVWSDAAGTITGSTNDNSVTLRARGGYRLFTAAGEVGAYLPAGSGAWASLSDRNMKENVQQVNGREVLEKVAALPIATWNYKTQDATTRHMGPMAQDFAAAFGVGENNTTITTIDADGVALAAIQGLNGKLEEQKQENQALKQENEALAQRLNELEAVVRALVKR